MLASGALGLGLAGATVARGDVYYWQGGGGDSNVTTAGNWVGGTAPPNDFNTVFVFSDAYQSGAGNYSPTINLDRALRGLIFAGGRSFTLGRTDPGNDLRLGSGGLTQNSTANQFITTPVRLAALQSWSFGAGAGDLIFQGDGAINNQGYLLSVSTDGTNRLDAVISGAGGFAKTGSGTLLLTQANTYTGATSIQNGTLELRLDTDSTFNSALDSNGSAGNGVTLRKSGGGTLTLAQAGTFAGTTAINGGQVRLGTALALQNSTVSLGVDNGLMFTSRLGAATVGGLTGPGRFALSDADGNALNLTVNTAAGTNSVYAGVLSGPGGLIKSGAGTFTLAGGNTYTGTTTLASGTLGISGRQPLGQSPTLNYQGGILLATDNAQFTATINDQTSGGTVILAAAPGATLNYPATGNNGLIINQSAGSTLQFGAPGQMGTVVFSPSGFGLITPTNGNTSNTNLATRVVAGTLQSAGAILNDADLTLNAGATLDLANLSPTVLGLFGTGTVNTSVPTGTGNVLTLSGGDFSGSITGPVSLVLTSRTYSNQTTTSTLILRAANDFTGSTTVNSGAVRLEAANALQNSTVVLNKDNGLVFGTGSATYQVGGLSGSGSLSLNDVNNNVITLQIGQNGSDTTYAGGLNGDGNITKTGTGTLKLTGSSPMRGTVTVAAGTLAISSGGSLYGVSLRVGAGGSLAINGTGAITASTSDSGKVDGTATAPARLVLGDNASLASYEFLNIGYNGYGEFVQTGGRANFFSPQGFTGSLYLGTNAGSSGSFTLSGTGVAALPIFFVGYDGNGVLTQNGGQLIMGATNRITLANNSGSSGTVNLNGGTMSVGGVSGGSGTSAFNFNGGLLQATSDTARFFQDLTTANVRTGAARIDTQSYNVMINQALLHDTNSGAAAADGGLIKTGSGTLTLTKNNTYTGPTNINAGTLRVNNLPSTDATVAGRLGGTSQVTIANYGTLLLTGDAAATDRINNAASVTISQFGTLATGGLSEGSATTGATAGVGALTLRSGATIDFGSGASGSTLLFQSLLFSSRDTVNILDYSGTARSDNGSATNDRLLFVNDPHLTVADLANWQFRDDAGTLFATGGMEIVYNGFYEIVPVPEPATWLGGLVLLGAMGWLLRRRWASRAAA